MKKIWFVRAWEDYLKWQTEDKKILKKINGLVKEAERTPFGGQGKPEPLKGDLSGFRSRRITDEDRLICRLKDGVLILSCKGRYDA